MTAFPPNHAPGGAVLLRSKLLEEAGFRHGFTTRQGGVSLEPFQSLNLARNVGDAPEHVAENHARVARAVGYEPGALFEASQVHGAAVLTVRAGEDAAQRRAEEADALVTRDAVVGVRVADCLPVLVGDTRSGAVAAVHVGWRGAVAGVLPAALRALRALGADAGAEPGALRAAIGPHIRVDDFEIGDDVAEQIRAAAPGVDPIRAAVGAGKPHADLAAVVRAQLAAAGLSASQVEDVGGSTYAEPALYFSYRRDGARAGRQAAIIAARPKSW